MYKWPHGRVIRMICAVFSLVVAGDLAWNGAQGPLTAYFGPEGGSIRQLIIGGVFALLALCVLVGGIVATGFHHKAVDFLIEVEQEMTRVTWPTLHHLTRSTLFIAVMIVILATGILVVDLVNKSLLDFLFGVNS